MALIKYIQRLKRIDDLIERKATGGPNEFAKKLNLSRSVLLGYLQEMKKLGFPIKFCKNRNSYYYDQTIKEDKVIGKLLSKEDQSKIIGGMDTSMATKYEFLQTRLYS